MAVALIGLGIAAGSQIIGGAIKAKKQSTAAKKAAEEQVKATQESNRLYQQGMGQMGSLYAPYINSGAGAIGTLGRLTTPGPGAKFASPGPPNAMPQGPPPNTAVRRGGGGYPGGPGGIPGGRVPNGPMMGGTFSQMGPPPGRRPQGPPPGYYQY